MRASLPCIEVGGDALANAERALSLEWLLADGTGSYASSTVLGCNTRRYHGLLVGAQRPPFDRTVLLSKVEEELLVDGTSYPLSTNEYPGCFHPEGYKYLVGFRLAPLPEWTFAVGGVLLRKRIVPLRGRRAFALCYQLEGVVEDALLRIVPLIASRGFHEINQREQWFGVERGAIPGEIVVRRCESGLSVHLWGSRGDFEEKRNWYHRMSYRREIERGFDAEEELFSPGAFVVPMARREPFTLVGACDSLPPVDLKAEEHKEIGRLQALLASAGAQTWQEQMLLLAADAFIVNGGRGEQRFIIAGYPWFDPWGRDTLVALEGLTLLTRRFDDARRILLELAARIRNGLVPNFLAAEPQNDALNSIDASLWFVHAVSRYHLYTGDDETVRNLLWPKVREILQAYLEGTLFGIRAEEDALVTGGNPTTQLTWMDAKVHGQPVTPRHGKAIEVNALWYNAVCVAEALAGRFGFSAEQGRYGRLAREVQESFGNLFLSSEQGYLYDYVEGDVRDKRLRPNQILAIGLSYPVLGQERWQAAVNAVRKYLYTPRGLRTLAPFEAGYRGIYVGSPEERDYTYHQGTAWPWLLGFFYEAFLKVHDFSEAARSYVMEALLSWSSHYLSAGLGTVSEIFDGDAPQNPRGCIAQAWSVAELLRVFRLAQSFPHQQCPAE